MCAHRRKAGNANFLKFNAKRMKLANSESALKADQNYFSRFVKNVDFKHVSFVSPTGARGLEKPLLPNFTLVEWNLQIRNQRENQIKIS